MSNPRTLSWILAIVAALALAALAWRGIDARQATRAQGAGGEHAAVVELAPADTIRAEAHDLEVTRPISGTLQAVRSATVRARSAGQLRDLTLRAGDSVEAGQVIARIDAPEYQQHWRQASEQVRAAEAQAQVAQRDWDNNRALADRGFISSTALANSAANLKAAQANVRAAQAAAAVARGTAGDTVIRAPISGQVARRLAQPGERVPPEAPIIEIIDPSALELEATLAPADSVAVRVGQRARIHIEGARDSTGASVARINPSADAASRNVLAYLAVDHQTGARQELFAQGEVIVGRLHTLALPLDAVATDAPRPYVRIVEDSGTRARVVFRPVEIGVRTLIGGETWVAVNGVPADAIVLRSTAGALPAGTAVRVSQPARVEP